MFKFLPFHCRFLLFASLLAPACGYAEERVEIPAGTILEVRLTTPIASYSSGSGDTVEGLLVAPVKGGNQVIAPQGTLVSGHLAQVRKVGLGIRHESARLVIVFDHLQLPESLPVSFASRVVELENARETLTRDGEIRGIDPLGVPTVRANTLLASLVQFEPIAYLYVNVACSRLLHFAEPEIYFPPGSELKLRVTQAVTVPVGDYALPPPVADGELELDRLRDLVRKVPYRTRTVGSNSRPTDLTNILMVGEPEAVKRAFRAAGWVESDRLTASTGLMALRSMAANNGYISAPMSQQTMDGKAALFNFSKTLDTFSKRDHLRVFARPETWNGEPLMAAAATHDIAIGFVKARARPVHEIDTQVDGERTKVVNDLVFTGCVTAVQMIPRPWLPSVIRNATGESLISDGQIAVLQFNQCTEPSHAVQADAPPSIRTSGSSRERSVRLGLMTVRNDLLRANLFYQGYAGLRLTYEQLSHKTMRLDTALLDVAARPAVPDGEVSTSGESLTGLEPGDALLESKHRPWPSIGTEASHGPHMEVGLQRGSFFDRRGEGQSLGTTVTFEANRYLGNEIGFMYQKGDISGQRAGNSWSGNMTTRQFECNVMVHVRPLERRFRPYFVAGPAVQLTTLSGSHYQHAGSLFRVGLQDVGLLVSAYQFNNRSVMSGGGQFRLGAQYGLGAKYRLSHRWVLQTDMRETIAPSPSLWTKSATGYLRQQRISMGFSFAF